MRRNQLDFIRQILYSLKMDYGFPIGIYHITSNVLNLETGKMTVATSKTSVARAIVLPNDVARKFSYDLAFISANRNFTEGAFYDLSTRIFIVDRRDTGEFTLSSDDYIVYDNKRYNVLDFQESEHKQAYMIITKGVKGEDTYQFIEVYATDRINASENFLTDNDGYPDSLTFDEEIEGVVV